MALLSPYRPLFRFPGVVPFVGGGAIARLGGAMFGVSLIVAVSTRLGSYALAGSISAVALVILAVAGPVIGRLIDRHGQARVATPFILLTAVAGLATVVVLYVGAPVWTVFTAYGLSALLPEIGPMSRARWVHLCADQPQHLHAAMSLEQILDEMSFVLGPILGVALATQWFPEAGLLVAEILYTIGSLVFLTSRATEPATGGHPGGRTEPAVTRPGVLTVTVVLVMTGTIFGANEVSAVALADHWGDKGFASIIVGLFAAGSGLSGVVFGTRAFRMSQSRRFLIAAAAMVLLEVPALFVGSLWALAGVMFVAGWSAAPMLITGMSLAQHLVPRHLVTESIAVTSAGILIGLSIGAAVGGWAIERIGAQPSYLVPVAAGALALVIAAGWLRSLERAERAARVHHRVAD